MANSCPCSRTGCRPCGRAASDAATYGVLSCLNGYSNINCGCGCNGRSRRCGCGSRGLSGDWSSGGCGCTFPFYTGPCAPGCEYASPDYPMPCRPGACPHPYDVSYACACEDENGDEADAASPGQPCRRDKCRCGESHCALTAFVPLTVAAGGAIPLSPTESCASGRFEFSGGGITFLRSGTYFVSFSANIPRDVSLATTLSLWLSGTELSPSVTPVDTQFMDSAAGFTGTTVLSVKRGDTLSLRTSEALVLSGMAALQPIFAMTLFSVH